MRLVHGHQRNRRMAREATEPFRLQTFRRDVEQLDPSRGRQRKYRRLLVRRLRGVDERGRNADVVQRVDLIAHQRDQRRDDDGRSRQNRGRNLIAYGFSGPGGHDAEDVMPGENVVDHTGLPRTERFVSEISFQRSKSPGIHVFSHCSSLSIRFVRTPAPDRRSDPAHPQGRRRAEPDWRAPQAWFPPRTHGSWRPDVRSATPRRPRIRPR